MTAKWTCYTTIRRPNLWKYNKLFLFIRCKLDIFVLNILFAISVIYYLKKVFLILFVWWRYASWFMIPFEWLKKTINFIIINSICYFEVAPLVWCSHKFDFFNYQNHKTMILPVVFVSTRPNLEGGDVINRWILKKLRSSIILFSSFLVLYIL